MRFFTGLHQPSDARHFEAAFISVNRLRNRKSGFVVGDWIMDSGAFTTILKHGGYVDPVSAYAEQIRRWAMNGTLLAAVAQDYMCEAHMLKITGMTIEQHQQLTIERYDTLTQCDVRGVYILPVLQGYTCEDYVRHIEMYGRRLKHGAWAGVGSVCKRNGDPRAIERVLMAIKTIRPDLRLHGFGLKSTALSSWIVRELLYTADSMAWSFAARKQGRNANDWREAKVWSDRINCCSEPTQRALFTAEELCTF
ncbi:hypothetical protein CUJ89_08480 [Burkholderia pyrrocinia]|uniref:DeoxyPurine in DNA protein A domain-containing protein n=1 Tax=Burkholderia pyrrocinia TaxID=60550 RepID=A0A2Z5MTG4_BURPY|nr:hypothetical protein [Burkholderia pyrrocinia]AXF20511.1 hypothetical protein CUJ89_08480 [Burkholderia pyrrocinia]